MKNRRDIVEKEEKIMKTNNDYDDVGIKKKMALLDVLLGAKVDGKPLTDAEIAEEVDTFMFEGKNIELIVGKDDKHENFYVKEKFLKFCSRP